MAVPRVLGALWTVAYPGPRVPRKLGRPRAPGASGSTRSVQPSPILSSPDLEGAVPREMSGSVHMHFLARSWTACCASGLQWIQRRDCHEYSRAVKEFVMRLLGTS